MAKLRTAAVWSWPVFFETFWGAFGRAMVVAVVLMTFLAIFADTSIATFGSACFGFCFWALCAALYAADEGDQAVIRWRND